MGRRSPKERRHLNLALQGGGALGAFTWGVLDRLLEEDHIEFDTVSGASAGAVNAVAFAAGLAQGGRAKARKTLRALWEGIARAARMSGGASSLASNPIASALGPLLSPYQINPFNLDPLRQILLDVVDFEKLRADPPVKLLIAATNLKTEEPRLFTEEELTIDTVLASACLPTLHHAVWIDGDPYWDGGFSANPPLYSVIERSQAEETLLVRLIETGSDAPPARGPEIAALVNRLAFNRPLQDELRLLETLRAMSSASNGGGPEVLRRVGRHSLHEIDAVEITGTRLRSQSLTPSPGLIEALFTKGKTAAHDWLADSGPLKYSLRNEYIR